MQHLSQIQTAALSSRKRDSEKLPTERCLQNLPPRTPLNRQSLARALDVLTTHIPSLELTPDKVLIWNEALKDLSVEELQNGIKTFCLAHKEIYPGTNVIAIIRSYALGQHLQSNALDQWGQIVKAIRKCGFNQVPKFLNPITQKVVSCMGWSNLYKSENSVADRAHFIKLFENEVEKENLKRLSASK